MLAMWSAGVLRSASAHQSFQISLDVFARKDRDEMFDPVLFRQGGDLPVVERSYDVEGRVAGLGQRNESRFSGRAG